MYSRVVDGLNDGDTPYIIIDHSARVAGRSVLFYSLPFIVLSYNNAT
jgi:hypothetical protein